MKYANIVDIIKIAKKDIYLKNLKCKSYFMYKI